VRERPPFAKDFPRSPELDRLVDAFANGDYFLVRSGARALLAAPELEVAQAARALLKRTSPDANVLGILAMTGLLLCVIASYWIAHGHPPELPSASSTSSSTVK
jgi:hypothetical protein